MCRYPRWAEPIRIGRSGAGRAIAAEGRQDESVTRLLGVDDGRRGVGDHQQGRVIVGHLVGRQDVEHGGAVGEGVECLGPEGVAFDSFFRLG